MNFYNLAENRFVLVELVYIIEFSLAHTLGAKHRLSLNRVFQKYGRPVKATIHNAEGKEINRVVFDKPTSFTASYLNNKYTRHFNNKENIRI